MFIVRQKPWVHFDESEFAAWPKANVKMQQMEGHYPSISVSECVCTEMHLR